MSRLVGFFAIILMASSVFAFDHIPQDYAVVVNPAAAAVSAHLGAIQLSQVDSKECSSVVRYTGDTTLQFGAQTYKLTHLMTSGDQQLCPTDVDFTKLTQLVLVFQNSEYQNQIRFILDQANLPLIDVVWGQGNILPGKALN